MPEWDRNTPWRQGHVFTADSSESFGLTHAKSPDLTATVVISHDCDLAQLPGAESFVEVIVGRFIETGDGNFTHAKNVRTLHIPCLYRGAHKWIEICASNKNLVEKVKLADHLPDPAVQLSPEIQLVLQRWLAVRYRRAAFPDQFNKRLQEIGVEERLKKIMKGSGNHIIAVFFDVDGNQQLERTDPDDIYTLNIILLYETDDDQSVSRRVAEKAASEIEATFKMKCLIDGKYWKHIELQSCELMADTAISYRQSREFKSWMADYISLRSDPLQPMLE